MEKEDQFDTHSISTAELKVSSFEFLEWNPGHPALMLTSFVVSPYFQCTWNTARRAEAFE
jgi:hypothetical protein